MTQQPLFWRRKKLTELTDEEWESLCDGCGKCCLHKLEDQDTGELFFTSVACQLLNLSSCRCRRYPERSRIVPDCVALDSSNVKQLSWMPATCAYRLVAEGKPLPAWHPLVSGSSDSVHEAGVSVRGWAVSESEVNDVEDYIIDWRP